MATGTATFRSAWAVGSLAGAKAGAVAVSGIGPPGAQGPPGEDGEGADLTGVAIKAEANTFTDDQTVQGVLAVPVAETAGQTPTRRIVVTNASGESVFSAPHAGNSSYTQVYNLIVSGTDFVYSGKWVSGGLVLSPDGNWTGAIADLQAQTASQSPLRLRNHADQTSHTLVLTQATDTTANQPQAADDTRWATAAHDNRKARRIRYVYDTVAREVSRDESDGSRGYQIHTVHTTAPADAMLPNGSMCAYLSGAGSPVFKTRDAGGTVRTIPIGGADAAGFYSVADYGAVADGATDDSAAIQACEDAARADGVNVYFPAGTYRCASTITYGAAGLGVQNYHSWVGAGRNASKLHFDPALQVGIRVNGMFAGSMHGIGVIRPAGADGTNKFWYDAGAATADNTKSICIGIWMANESGGTGTGQTGNVFEHLLLMGWTRGIMAGDVANTRAASELNFTECQFQYNDVGFQGSDRNTLDINFIMCGWSHGRLGVDAGQAGCFQFYGGSCTGLTEADLSVGTGGTFNMHGFRSEETNYLAFIYAVNTLAPTTVNLTGCLVSSCLQVDGYVIRALGCFHLGIANCDLRGKIGLADYYAPYGGTISLRNTTIEDTEPFRFYYGDVAGIGDRSLNGIRYEVIGCNRYDGDVDAFIVGKFDDEVGITVGQPYTSPDYGYRMAAWKVDATTGVLTTKTAVTAVRGAYVGKGITGTIDGVNDTFTLANVPAAMGFVWNDGVPLSEGSGFSRVGAVLTMDTPPTARLSADYTVA